MLGHLQRCPLHDRASRLQKILPPGKMEKFEPDVVTWAAEVIDMCLTDIEESRKANTLSEQDGHGIVSLIMAYKDYDFFKTR
jgi:hypothetical protein